MYLESRLFKFVIAVIAVIQVFLGVAMIVAPGPFAEFSGLPEAPEWTGWLFAMFGARCLGYAVGLFAALRDPVAHRLWLQTMLGIQAIDWIATVAYLVGGSVTLSQVTTAAFLPVLFVVALLPTLRPSIADPAINGLADRGDPA